MPDEYWDYLGEMKTMEILSDEKKRNDPLSYPAGGISYWNYYTNEELKAIESKCLRTENNAESFIPCTAQKTYQGKLLVRTKFFFGYRYMWNDEQLCSPYASVSKGVRSDVSSIPHWMKKDIVNTMADGGIFPQGFINEIAMNVYHDGTEGL